MLKKILDILSYFHLDFFFIYRIFYPKFENDLLEILRDNNLLTPNNFDRNNQNIRGCCRVWDDFHRYQFDVSTTLSAFKSRDMLHQETFKATMDAASQNDQLTFRLAITYLNSANMLDWYTFGKLNRGISSKFTEALHTLSLEGIPLDMYIFNAIVCDSVINMQVFLSNISIINKLRDILEQANLLAPTNFNSQENFNDVLKIMNSYNKDRFVYIIQCLQEEGELDQTTFEHVINSVSYWQVNFDAKVFVDELIQTRGKEAKIAFACGLLERTGANSVVKNLPQEIVHDILELAYPAHK
jgi:hypothetical protein